MHNIHAQKFDKINLYNAKYFHLFLYIIINEFIINLSIQIIQITDIYHNLFLSIKEALTI